MSPEIYLVVGSGICLLMWVVALFGAVIGPSKENVATYGFLSAVLDYWDDRLDANGDFWPALFFASLLIGLGWGILIVLALAFGLVVLVALPFRGLKKDG